LTLLFCYYRRLWCLFFRYQRFWRWYWFLL